MMSPKSRCNGDTSGVILGTESLSVAMMPFTAAHKLLANLDGSTLNLYKLMKQ